MISRAPQLNAAPGNTRCAPIVTNARPVTRPATAYDARPKPSSETALIGCSSGAASARAISLKDRHSSRFSRCPNGFLIRSRYSTSRNSLSGGGMARQGHPAAERLRAYLRQLKPGARALLISELERGLLHDTSPAGAEMVLAELDRKSVV